MKLPDGRVVRVVREEHYKDKDHYGTWYWNSELILIPRLDGQGSPIVWRSSWDRDAGVPWSVTAVALYYEDGKPRLVTEGGDILDYYYGCSYTEGHRLFVWDEKTGWAYDWRTRIHTHYVGDSNLYSGDFPKQLNAEIKKQNGLPGPVSGLLRRGPIDTLHETPRCNYAEPGLEKYARHSLQEVMEENKQ